MASHPTPRKSRSPKAPAGTPPRRPRTTSKAGRKTARRGRTSGRGTPAIAVSIVLILAALAAAVWLIEGPSSGTPPPPQPPQPAEAERPTTGEPRTTPETPREPTPSPPRHATPAPEARRPPAEAPGGRTRIPVPGGIPERPVPETKKRLVIVIDDVGYNRSELEPFLRFPGPLTFAVLPRLPYSEESARRIQAAGKEVILHQPMEALNGEDPGPGAIRVGMDELTVGAIISENLSTVPGAVGMNNHMGSAVTQDPDTMRAVLDAAWAAGVYYLDSLTVSDSVVHSIAQSLNLKNWERDVFLDNYPERAAILKQFDEGLKHAEKKGLSVMIGHVWSAELAQTLIDLYPSLIDQGFSLTTISRIMLEDSDEDTGD